MAEPAKPRLLLLGFDAADWRIATPLLDAGRLPFLAQLVGSGVIGNLNTLLPPVPDYVWTSLLTGQTAARHGITGPAEPVAGLDAVRPAAATSRLEPDLGEILAQRGLRSVLVHWPVTHPAPAVPNLVTVSPIHGMVAGSGFEDWALPADCVQPAEHREIMAGLRLHPAEVTGEQLLPLVPAARTVDQASDPGLSHLAHTVAGFATTHGAGTWFAEKRDWDLLAVHYRLHRDIGWDFAALKVRRDAGEDSPDVRTYGEVVERAYELMDAALGRYMALVGRETTILLVSAHGHVLDPLQTSGAATGQEAPRGWPRLHGMFLAAGPALKKDDRVYGAHVLDIVPTVLALLDQPVAGDLPGRVLTVLWPEPPFVGKIDSPRGSDRPVETQVPLSPSDKCSREVRECYALRFRVLIQEHVGRRELQPALTLSRQLCEWDDAPSHRLLRAQVLLQARQLDEAARMARTLADDPQLNLEARMLLCQLALAAGRIEEAKQLATAIPDSAVGPELMRLRAELDRGMGDWAACIARCREVLVVEPECIWAKSILGVALHHSGRHEEAVGELQHAVGLLQGPADTHMHLGQALQALGHDEWAERAYLTALSLDRLQPEAHGGLGRIHRKRNQPALASHHFELEMAVRHQWSRQIGR